MCFWAGSINGFWNVIMMCIGLHVLLYDCIRQPLRACTISCIGSRVTDAGLGVIVDLSFRLVSFPSRFYTVECSLPWCAVFTVVIEGINRAGTNQGNQSSSVSEVLIYF